MATRPQFDSRISLGNILQFGTLIVGGLYALFVMQDQAQDNATAIGQVSKSVNAAVARLEREIDNDLDEVGEVVGSVDLKVDELVTEQRTSVVRLQAAEREVGRLDVRVNDTRSIALAARSTVQRDAAVAAERHNALIGAIADIQQTVRGIQQQGN
jgi:hypothetical protein